MSQPIIRITIPNIIGLWFGADTPIRQYKATMNPHLWQTCQRVAATFTPPSGATSKDRYRRMDYVAFAKLVQQEMELEEATLCY